MTINHHASSLEILGGPIGSRLNDRHGLTTKEVLLNEEHHPKVRELHREDLLAGSRRGVTGTFGASPRGIEHRAFTAEMKRWNIAAAGICKGEYGEERTWGSLAPLLDTSGGNDAAWASKKNRFGRSILNHTPQIETLIDHNVSRFIAEAVHDYHEALGIVIAARNAGAQEVIVSFEPTHSGPPNNDGQIASYDDMLGRLRDASKGKIKVGVGLNCGNAEQIARILTSEPEGTFSVIYPNQAVIPNNTDGDTFRRLADKNSHRSEVEDQEFQKLRGIYELPTSTLERIVDLAREKQVACVGLCCGASSENIHGLSEIVQHRRMPLRRDAY